jgi:hypothetical protein
MAKQQHVWGPTSCMQWQSSGCAGYLGKGGPIEACGAGRDPRERPRAVGRSRLDTILRVSRTSSVYVFKLLMTMYYGVLCYVYGRILSTHFRCFRSVVLRLCCCSLATYVNSVNPCGDPPRTGLPHLALKAESTQHQARQTLLKCPRRTRKMCCRP